LTFAFDFDQHPFTVDVFQLQVHGFTDPESCRIGGHQNKAVLEIVRGTDGLPHIFHGKDFGKSSRVSRDAVGDTHLIFDDVL
jgi:hypothetical protein